MKILPEYVIECGICNGTGETVQTYTVGCGGGYFKSKGPCEICGKDQHYRGVGYLYKATGAPVPKSVIAQIINNENT